MVIQEKHLFTEGLNSDDTLSLLKPTEFINAENIRFGTTNKGSVGHLEAIGSNVLITNSYLPNTGTNFCIGSVEDKAKQRLIFFNWNSLGANGIYCLDKGAAILYKVLLDSQVTGGLNFSKYNIIHSANVVGNLLKWTDGLNEPKQINIEAGIKTNHSGYSTTVLPYSLPIKYTTTTVIKRPPIYPVNIQKVTDNLYNNNFIQNGAYQFAVRYQYRDNEYSALSAFSHLSPLNYSSDTFNKINITFNSLELIDDDIFQIDLCVKYGNYGKTFIIKSWDKNSDLAAINAHNAGTTLLNYGFYDDQNGIALSDVESVTNQDLVPLIAKAQEVARNRMFYANILQGYDTPFASSLAVTLGTASGGGGTYTGTWKYVNMPYMPLGGGAVSYIAYYYAYNNTLSPNTAFFFDGSKFSNSPLASYSTSAATAAYNTETNLAGWIQRNYSAPAGNMWGGAAYAFFAAGGTTNLIVPGSLGNIQFFKSNSTYKVSIAFYDQFRRKCGLVKNYVTAAIPIRTNSQTTFNAVLNWTLSNTNALAEIPSWAFYYQIHISKNQTTRYFLQTNVANTVYAKQDPVTKVITNSNTTYASANTPANSIYAVGFDFTPMIANGYGYTYNVGDEVIFYSATGGATLTLPVLAVNGNFVYVTPFNAGDLTTVSNQNIIEIYTPYRTVSTEPLYETGAIYPVSNPTTNSRVYSVLSDTINGDCYAIQRDKGSSNLYYCEAMSPNDKFWQIWQTDTGWVNAVDKLGQQSLTGHILASDVIINGTKVNGLNKFQPLNVYTVPKENGAINKIKLTSKVEDAGTVLLAICNNQVTSAYLEESQLVSNSGNAFITSSSNTIGTMNTLKGSYGCINPESVVEYRGDVFWFDANSGCFVMYSVNGVESISNYKTKRASKLFSDKFLSTPQATIEGYGSRPFIFGAVDVYHEEILWSIPQVEATNPNGNLVDYSSPARPYPYDFYDGMAKTIVFKKYDDMNKWFGSYKLFAEMFGNVGSSLYAFSGGNLYIQNQAQVGYNNFFGVQYLSRLMYVVNSGQNVVKTLETIKLNSTLIPSFTHFRSEYPNVQSSDLYAADFNNKEGVLYAPIMRDRLSPNSTGTYDQIVFTGDKMRAVVFRCLLEFDVSGGALGLTFVTVGVLPSIGHV